MRAQNDPTYRSALPPTPGATTQPEPPSQTARTSVCCCYLCFVCVLWLRNFGLQFCVIRASLGCRLLLISGSLREFVLWKSFCGARCFAQESPVIFYLSVTCFVHVLLVLVNTPSPSENDNL